MPSITDIANCGRLRSQSARFFTIVARDHGATGPSPAPCVGVAMAGIFGRRKPRGVTERRITTGIFGFIVFTSEGVLVSALAKGRSLCLMVRRLYELWLQGRPAAAPRQPPPNPLNRRRLGDVLRSRHRGDARVLPLLATRPDDHDWPIVAASAPARRLKAQEIRHLVRVAGRHAVDLGDPKAGQREGSSHGQANSSSKHDPLCRLMALGRHFTKPHRQLTGQFVSVLPSDGRHADSPCRCAATYRGSLGSVVSSYSSITWKRAFAMMFSNRRSWGIPGAWRASWGDHLLRFRCSWLFWFRCQRLPRRAGRGCAPRAQLSI